MKRAALYMGVSTFDQHSETQLYDLRQMALQHGYEILSLGQFVTRLAITNRVTVPICS